MRAVAVIEDLAISVIIWSSC